MNLPADTPSTGAAAPPLTPMYRAPLLAFYSRPFYREVALSWRTRGFIYLLLLLCVCWVPALVQMSIQGSHFMATRADDFIRQLPTLTIAGGKASIDGEEPLFIIDRETGQEFAIIDTTGEITSLDGFNAAVLITGTQILTQQGELDTRSYDLSTIQDLTLTPADAYRWLNLTMIWGPAFLFPFLVVGSFAVRLLQTFFYALIGMVLKLATGTNLDFASLLSVSIMAITPAIVAATILLVLGITPPLGWLLFFGLSMAYLLFGMSATVTTDSPASQDSAS
jgi:hypothetical protein